MDVVHFGVLVDQDAHVCLLLANFALVLEL